MGLESVDSTDDSTDASTDAADGTARRTGAERLDPADVDVLAPFVAWMATQELCEDTRRGYRETVEAFMIWSRGERADRAGPDGAGHAEGGGARSRFADRLDRRERASANEALDLFAGYRTLRARTLPVEEQH